MVGDGGGIGKEAFVGCERRHYECFVEGEERTEWSCLGGTGGLRVRLDSF